MRNHLPSYSARLSSAVLRVPAAKRKRGVGAAAVAAVVCLHAAALCVGLRHTTNVLTVPDKQPSTLTFELSAPAQPEVEAPGPVTSQPVAPPAPPKSEPKPVMPVKPSRPAEPKKKPVEKKPVEKPAPVKSVKQPTQEPSAPAVPQPQADSASPTSEQGGAASTTVPAGTGGQKLAAVPAQVGRFQANNPHPKYPMQARRRHMEGLVVLTVHVNEDGRVAEARVKTSSGYELLDDSALETVRLWRFEPSRQDGSAAASWTDVRINFHLN